MSIATNSPNRKVLFVKITIGQITVAVVSSKHASIDLVAKPKPAKYDDMGHEKVIDISETDIGNEITAAMKDKFPSIKPSSFRGSLSWSIPVHQIELAKIIIRKILARHNIVTQERSIGFKPDRYMDA